MDFLVKLIPLWCLLTVTDTLPFEFLGLVLFSWRVPHGFKDVIALWKGYEKLNRRFGLSGSFRAIVALKWQEKISVAREEG